MDVQEKAKMGYPKKKCKGEVLLRKLLCVFLTLLVLTLGSSATATSYVALTFDDGPSGENTEVLLEMLEKRRVQATFFLCGYRIEAYPDQPASLSKAGHELGVHGYSHTCFDTMDPETLREELQATTSLIYEKTGKKPVLLRPPCGAWNDTVRSESRDAGLTVILWSVDPKDWSCHDSAEIARRVCEKAENGSVILLHDMHQSSIDAAAKIIDTLRAQDYAFVTVSELAELAESEIRPGEVYSQFSAARAPES